MIMAMISLALLSFLSHLIMLTAQFNIRYSYCFNDAGNYTDTSAYSFNLYMLLSTLTSNTQIDYGFYNFSIGRNPNTVSAIGLCRGDVKPDACRSCLNKSAFLLPRLCPNQKEAMMGYDECMLRYSNRSILGAMEDDFLLYLWNPNDATDLDKFNQVVDELLERLRSKAAAGDSLRKFASANETGPSFQTIFGLVQCMPDLSELDCSDCLVKAFSEIPQCCGTKRGGRVIKRSCNIRYENYRFYEPVADDSPPQASPPLPLSSSPTNSSPSEGKGDTGSHNIIVIVIPIFVIVMLSGLGCSFLWRKARKSNRAILQENFGEESSNLKSLRFNLATIEAATNKFSNENRIGKGGFGEVYKGILSTGQEIAVKRLKKFWTRCIRIQE